MVPKACCVLFYIGSFAGIAFAGEFRIFHPKSPYLEDVKDQDLPKVFDVYERLSREPRCYSSAALLKRDVYQLIDSMDARINMEGRKSMREKLVILSLTLGWREWDHYKSGQNVRKAIHADKSLSDQEKEKRMSAIREADAKDVDRLRAMIVAAFKNGWSVVPADGPKKNPKK